MTGTRVGTAPVLTQGRPVIAPSSSQKEQRVPASADRGKGLHYATAHAAVFGALLMPNNELLALVDYADAKKQKPSRVW